MSKASEFFKSLLKEGIKEIFNDFISDKKDDIEEIEKENEVEKQKIELELQKLKETKAPEVEIKAIRSNVVPIETRFFRINENLTYHRKMITTTFCNETDFKGETYPLATNSPYTSVQKGKMKGMRGVSLPIPIVKERIVYPIVPSNGIMFGYKQVDVGPGYTKDDFITELRPSKNEIERKDYLGHPSAGASLDLWPQVWEDLGICTFEEAYEGQISRVLDMMVWNPVKDAPSKVDGHDIPSGDKRPWWNSLPPDPSPFFPWRELLRGWNVQYAPNSYQIANLQLLVKEVLLPLRAGLGNGRLKISNGLRDKDTNKRVGGRELSLHLEGRAVDIVPLDTTMETVYNWAKETLKPKIRELLWEYPNANNEHIHIAGPIRTGENQNIRIKT